MKQIKRFDLRIESHQTISIPFNSEILGMRLFNDMPALWVLVDDSHKDMSRTFLMVSALKELSPRLNRTNYVGGFEHKGHVFHVFEE